MNVVGRERVHVPLVPRHNSFTETIVVSVLLIGLCRVACATNSVATASLTLAWNPSPSASVSGYVVYYGTNSGVYTASNNVGSQTSAVVTDLIPGLSYYFGVTAVSTNGTESQPSNEVTCRVALVELLNLIQAYDGTPHAVTVTTTPLGLPVTVTYEGSAALPVEVGSYAVVATVADTNYVGSVTNTMVIGLAVIGTSQPGSEQTNGGMIAPEAATIMNPSGLNLGVSSSGSVGVPVNSTSNPVVVIIIDTNTLNLAGWVAMTGARSNSVALSVLDFLGLTALTNRGGGRSASSVPGDLNGDGVVDQSEFAEVLAHLNGNGTVSESDLELVLARYWPASPWLDLTNTAGLGGSLVTFSLTNSFAGAFSVEGSTNLLDWDYLGAAALRYEFLDTNAPALPLRYYRLRWP